MLLFKTGMMLKHCKLTLKKILIYNKLIWQVLNILAHFTSHQNFLDVLFRHVKAEAATGRYFLSLKT